MKSDELTRQRLLSQSITRPTFEKPGDVVRWLGAVQAQDYLGSLWAIGLRMREAVEADIERAIAERDIVRTWPMRGTIHFVACEDVRWMLKLMASRVIVGNGKRLQRQFELDGEIISRAERAVTIALRGRMQMTRGRLYSVLDDAGIPTLNSRGLMILGWLAHEGVICFGPRQGKQPTFALLDEWIPREKSRSLTRDEALHEIALRYFTSHGPATLHDFAWWTGLSVADARSGVEMAKSQLVQEAIDAKTYWLSPSAQAAPDTPPSAHLLPAFDEYTVAYKDRSAILDPAHTPAAVVAASGSVLNPCIEINGRITGNWKRTFTKGAVAISTHPYGTLSDAGRELIIPAAERYGRFQSMPAVLL